MEHRRSVRKRLRQRVTLDAPHIGSVAVKTRDLSLGGAFVETDSFVLPFNARVVVSFKLPHREPSSGFRVDAMVVRRAPTGAGLMFLRMETDVIHALSHALSQYGGLGPGPKRPRQTTS
jgi:hypothetical protein